jgi:chromosomal replication initiator protein
MKKTKRDKIIDSINSLSEIERQVLLSELMRHYKIINPIEFIQNKVCNYLHVPTALLKTNTRKRNIVFARHLIMYFARQTTELPLEAIGYQIGGKDHATVIHACKKIEVLIKKEPRISFIVHSLTEQLKV